ncbi:hypothetical protein AAE478_003649 [Parahypoxylon ruwenzoriense]
MGHLSNNRINWWAIVHTFAILGQLSLCAAGTVVFVFSRPSRFDDHIPSDDEFWSDVGNNSTFPWVSAAIGAFTTFVYVLLLVVLWKTHCVKSHQFSSRNSAFKNVVVASSIIVFFVTAVDITLAVKSGLSGRYAICAAAATGSVFSILTIFADQVKLRNLSNELKKSYVLELREEGTSVHPIAPPSYEAAIGVAK